MFVLPRQFPHKTYSGASFEQRKELLSLALAAHPRFSAAVSENGLFVEIADECRECYGADVQLSFLCGRDAAERIVNWDYGRPEAFLRCSSSSIYWWRLAPGSIPRRRTY